MAKKCKCYINIHYEVNASWESSGNFMFWKSLNFAEYCFHVVIVDVHTSRVACHTCRDLDYCSKQGRDTSQHAIIATYHRSVKQWKVFIDLESIVFSGSTRLLWIRVSPGSSSGIAGQNDIHADPKWHSCRNGTDFNTLISQSNFCIFHNTTQSVIICTWTFKKELNLTLFAWKWSLWRIKNICSKTFHEKYSSPKLQHILGLGLARIMSLLHVNSQW